MDIGAPAPDRLDCLAVRESGVVLVQRLCNGPRIVAHPLKSRPEDKPPPAALAAVSLDASGPVIFDRMESLLDYVGCAAPDAALWNGFDGRHDHHVALRARGPRNAGRRIAL